MAPLTNNETISINELPICPHNEDCGGCKYQHLAYEGQLRQKETEALRWFEDRGVMPAAYESPVASPEIYRYRNKMEYSFGDLVKDGPMTLGLHRPKSFMAIVTTDQCQLVHEDFNRVLSATLDHCVTKDYSKYHKRTHQGLLRSLILRRGVHTGELLVAIVTTSSEAFEEEAFVSCIQNIPDLEHEVVGILHIIDDNISDALHIEEQRVLFGRGYYNEVLLGLKFQVGIASFFQANVKAVERLYTDGINLIEDYGQKTVYDLFCGTGTITQIVAKRAKEAVGVEIVPEAVAMARESALANGIDNCRFEEGDVFEVLDRIPEKPDTIIVDPPRPGIGMKTMAKILAYNVPEIVYISCNPKTLAQDAAFAKEQGYELTYLRFYDNFPFTKHLECVALLSKAK